MTDWIYPNSRRRNQYGGAAALLFFVITVASIWRLPPVELHWGWLAVAVIMALASLFLIAAEYRLAAALVSERVPWNEALRVTILSSAANLLPLPGGLVVRTEALRRKGSSLPAALASNVVMGLGWLGISLVLAGGLLLSEEAPGLGSAFLILGFLTTAAMGEATRRLVGVQRLWLSGGLVLGLEGLYVAMSAVRLYAILAGLGIEVSYAQAITLTVASALAAGVGVFPGGLGLRELLAGALAPLVGLAPAVGAFSGVGDRVVNGIVITVMAAILWKPLTSRGSRSDSHLE